MTVADLLVQDQCKLPAFSQKKVVVSAPHMEGACFVGFVYPHEHGAANGVLCARGFPAFWGGKSEVLIVNATNSVVNLRKGDTVGAVSLMTKDEFMDSVPSEVAQHVETNDVKIPENLDLNSAKKNLKS